jgi:DNA-binding CsgD family transcriptional regulator
MREAPRTPPFALGPRLQLGALRNPLRRLAAERPRVGFVLHQVKQHLERRWSAHSGGPTRDALYQTDARMRAHEYTGYRSSRRCREKTLSRSSNRRKRRITLNRREAEVLLWVSRGKTSRETATILSIASKTVDKHVERIQRKLGAENRTVAAAIAWAALRNTEHSQ